MEHAPIRTSGDWLRLLLGLTLVFALFHGSAIRLGSERGEAGLIICLLVVAALVGVERILFGTSLPDIPIVLGLSPPPLKRRRATRGLAAGIGACVMLALVVPVFAMMQGLTFTLLPGWLALVPGLFAQGGIAEEVLFRGYLFGHLRRGRTFWRAAALSMLPFAVVHLLLFTTMPWPIAVAALTLSVALSVPLAHLFELGGSTIWAPALMHAVIQGTVKIVVFPGEAAATFAIVWMAASAVVGVLLLLVGRRGSSERRREPL